MFADNIQIYIAIVIFKVLYVLKAVTLAFRNFKGKKATRCRKGGSKWKQVSVILEGENEETVIQRSRYIVPAADHIRVQAQHGSGRLGLPYTASLTLRSYVRVQQKIGGIGKAISGSGRGRRNGAERGR